MRYTQRLGCPRASARGQLDAHRMLRFVLTQRALSGGAERSAVRAGPVRGLLAAHELRERRGHDSRDRIVTEAAGGSFRGVHVLRVATRIYLVIGESPDRSAGAR